MQEIWDASLNPWIGKILWRRKWLPTPVFLPGESHDRGPWRATVHGVTKSQTQLKWQHPYTDKQPVTIKSRYYFCYWLYICVCVYVCVCVYIIYVCVFMLFSRQVMSNSVTPWTAAHQTSLSLTLGVCPSSCPLNRWCPTISSSATLFSFCLWSFPASGSFPMSLLFASGGQSIGASASASVLPMSVQGWFLLRLICIYSQYILICTCAHTHTHTHTYIYDSAMQCKFTNPDKMKVD